MIWISIDVDIDFYLENEDDNKEDDEENGDTEIGTNILSYKNILSNKVLILYVMLERYSLVIFHCFLPLKIYSLKNPSEVLWTTKCVEKWEF